jgi:hypothetical protein
MFLTPGLVTSGSNSMTTLSHLHQNRKFLMNRRFSYFTSFNHWHKAVISEKPSHVTSLNLGIRSQMYFWPWDFLFLFLTASNIGIDGGRIFKQFVILTS